MITEEFQKHVLNYVFSVVLGTRIINGEPVKIIRISIK